MVHRDLKPENIKIAPDGVTKILDFGLAKSAYADSVDQFCNIEGTLYYLSPEQITGENVTCLSDIFSFGVVLYELLILTGRRPFEGVYSAAIVYSILHEDPLPPTSIQKELPSWSDGYLLKLLAKQGSARFAGTAEVVEQMESCLRTQGKPCPTDELKSRQTVTVIDLKNLSLMPVGNISVSALPRNSSMNFPAAPTWSSRRNHPLRIPVTFGRCLSASAPISLLLAL